MFYFAYGSNMNHAQMKRRCPDSIFICQGRLGDYKFVYDGVSKTWDNKAVANIVEFEGGEVLGGIFNISSEDRDNLDGYEGYNKRVYDRKKIEIQGFDGEKYQCYTYLRKAKEIGEPSAEYRDVIIRGAQDCGLDDTYIKKEI